MLSRRIFVTGATGLAGAHILHYLLHRGYTNITALRRKTSRMDLVSGIADRIEWVEGDVTDIDSLAEAMQGASWVIHAAALISYDKGMDAQMFEINTRGTENVVNAALANNVDKLLHISSVAALSKTEKSGMLGEKGDPKTSDFTSVYGLTKYLAEMEVWRGNAEGLATAIINPSVILGSGYWNEGSLQIIQRVASGLRYYPVGGTGFVDVRDLARLALLRLESDGIPGRMIANGWNSSYKELFDELSAEVGVKKPAIRVSPVMAEIAWRLLLPFGWISRNQHAITRYTARVTSSTVRYDNSLSLQVPGFAYTDRSQTLRDIAVNYKISVQNGMKALPMPFGSH